MKDKKRILSGILDKTRLLKLLELIPENTLTIVNYHRIYDDKLETAFDSGVFGPSVAEFDQQMAFLGEHANLLSEEEVISLANSGEPLKKRNVFVTFDDGYKDNYLYAVPVLRKYNVPAAFFIPIDNIDNSRVGWWDIIAYFVKHTGKDGIPFKERDLSLRSPAERKQAIMVLLRHMKSTKNEESRNFLSELSLLCDVDFPSKEIQGKELMSWDEIGEIGNDKLLSIGSHTVSHRVLSTVSDEEEFQELQDSRAFLQKKLDCKIKSIAYPVGGYTAFSDRTKVNARRAGYSIGYSFNTGVNYGSLSDPYNVKRIDPAGDFSTFKSTLILPRVFVQQPV